MSRNKDLRRRPPGEGRLEPVPVTRDTSSAEVIRRLQLTITRRLDGMLQGEYEGLVPGHGWDLGETRPYEPGDDVRRIDWNVSARTHETHVRDTIADRELETWLLADLSPSLDFGTADCEKRDLAVAGAAAVGFLTARTGNRLGALVLGPDGVGTMPARNGRNHLQAVLHRMIQSPRGDAGGRTDLAGAIARLDRIARRRGLTVVISDFISPDGWEQPFKRLTMRHEVLAIEVVDPRELELPDVGVLDLVDPETGERREIQTSNRRFRERYAEAAAAQRERITRAIRSSGADHLVLRTDRDWLLDLVRFVSLRRRRYERRPRSNA
jgi:uncharacterized protein (DUF58 family)